MVVDRRDGYTPPHCPDFLILYVVGHSFRDNEINSIFKYIMGSAAYALTSLPIPEGESECPL